MSRVYIDTREFSHPVPMEMAVDVIASLDGDSYLYMHHTKKPMPLLDLAKTQRLQSFYYEDSLAYFVIKTNDKGEQVMHFYGNFSTESQNAIKQ